LDHELEVESMGYLKCQTSNTLPVVLACRGHHMGFLYSFSNILDYLGLSHNGK